MGSRSATDTVLGVLAALIEHRTLQQAELANSLGVKSETIRKHMLELKEHGVPLERQEDGKQVFWSVPASWAPRGIHLDAGDAAAIVKHLARLPAGKHRDPLIDKLLKGLAGADDLERRVEVVLAGKVAEDELRWMEVVEDSAARGATLHMNYYTMSRGELAKRYVSVQRVVPPQRFVGRCHRDGRLKWFRIDNIVEARLDPDEPFRFATADEVDAYVEQSVGGFATPEPVREHVFVVRSPESRWVGKNLPLGDVTATTTPDGLQVSVRSAAMPMVARYVVSLGGAARAVSLPLRAAVRALAEQVLRENPE